MNMTTAFNSPGNKMQYIAIAIHSKGEADVDELFTKINGDNPIPEIMLNYQKLIASSSNTRTEEILLFTDSELKSLSIPSLMFFGEEAIMLNATEAIERYTNLVPNAKAVLLPVRRHSLRSGDFVVKIYIAFYILSVSA